MAVTVSIVTACFNSAATIRDCILSVAGQTYPDIEHVIVDGASADETTQIVREIAIPRTIFTSESDRGIYDAWNKGIRRAAGDYVLILNSDDKIFDARAVSDAVDFINAHGRPPVIYGKLRAHEKSTGYTYVDGRPATLDGFIFRMDMCTLATLIRRDVFDRVGYFDECYKIASDYDWAIRLFKTLPEDQIVFYDRILTSFSLDGVSNRHYRKAYSEIAAIIRRHYPYGAYLRHRAYVGGLMMLKRLMPIARATGILSAWRRLRFARTQS